MFGSFVLAAAAATTLTLVPWTGKDLPTATQAAAKYRLTISGQPGTTLHLKAKNIAGGWLAAFCTGKICSPMRTSVEVPKGGVVSLQFELIRQGDDAPKKSGATIVSDDGATVSL